MDIAVQEGLNLPADQGKEMLLLHDAAAEYDPLRGEGADCVYAHLSQIGSFQIPGGMIRREVRGFGSPALFQGGT